ncbi:FkbM family methyltransferase [Spiribacter roseus]|uniref:FkbM family methyltransferase n=1 Tax=Spiribacter roseus TaxID=1855875 RepID=UPI00132F8E16|nr:FkbM family methyltransferase [Spiribacter roseus]
MHARKVVKVLIKSTGLLSISRRVVNYFRKKAHPIQTTETDPHYEYRYLGTEYGGWFFVDDGTLENTTIVSAGLGEDASFDTEFAATFDANVVIVDPTPRAIKHFNGIEQRVGSKNTSFYVDGGCQPIDAYDLSNIRHGQLSIVNKALWDKPKEVKFFAPRNPQHVSHSIVNYQNDYSDQTESIDVKADTLASILKAASIQPSDLKLVKLDIEGAEIEVIQDMLANYILPTQILVEYDELNVPSSAGLSRVSKCDRALIDAGYKLIRTDGGANFLYYWQASDKD